jgi:hypothetical protein
MRLVINDLYNWQKWSGPLLFVGLVARDIDLHLNVSEPTEIWVKSFDEDQDETIKFCGLVPAGKSELKVNVGAGDAEMFFVSEGQVWFYDPAGRNNRRNSPEQRSFTTPPNPSRRDPVVEKLYNNLQLTMINQLRAQEARFQKQMDQMKAEQSSGVNVDPDTGEVTENVGNDTATTGTGEAAPTGNEDSSGTSSGTAEDEAGVGEGQVTDTATPPLNS